MARISGVDLPKDKRVDIAIAKYHAAEAKKIADTEEFKRKLAYTRTKLLMEHVAQNEARPR